MGEEKAKKAFVLYKKYAKPISMMSDEQAGILLKSIFAYEDGNEIEIEDLAVSLLFQLIKEDLDDNNERYEEIRAKRIEAGRKGGRPRKESESESEEANGSEEKAKKANGFSEKQTEAKKAVSVSVSVSDSILKEKDNTSYYPKRKVENFIPPTVDEVKSYAQQMNYSGFNAESFVNFYQSKGWMVGKNKMKDWKAAVVGWQSRNKDKPPGKQPLRNAQTGETRNLDFLAR